jgi:hypothetical protein
VTGRKSGTRGTKRSGNGSSAGQLTLGDWEAEKTPSCHPSREGNAAPSRVSREAEVDVARLATALAPRLAEELSARGEKASQRAAEPRRLLTLDELVAELPPAKRPETWKRWLYERTRRGEVPGCVKLGGMLFFEREPALTWLRAGAITR